MVGSIQAKEVDLHNKADIQLRKCLKCMNFNKFVYQCKLKKCDRKGERKC